MHEAGFFLNPVFVWRRWQVHWCLEKEWGWNIILCKISVNKRVYSRLKLGRGCDWKDFTEFLQVIEMHKCGVSGQQKEAVYYVYHNKFFSLFIIMSILMSVSLLLCCHRLFVTKKLKKRLLIFKEVSPLAVLQNWFFSFCSLQFFNLLLFVFLCVLSRLWTHLAGDKAIWF